MYIYRYTESELKEILEKCLSLSSKLDSIFVFINNSFMYENALEFSLLINSHLQLRITEVTLPIS